MTLKWESGEHKIQGAENIFKVLEGINLKSKIKTLRSGLYDNPPSKLDKILRRIRILEGFLSSEIQPAWMILTM